MRMIKSAFAMEMQRVGRNGITRDLQASKKLATQAGGTLPSSRQGPVESMRNRKTTYHLGKLARSKVALDRILLTSQKRCLEERGDVQEGKRASGKKNVVTARRG